jgi:3-oxoacyl-[acyl-carrier-protein] synthase II
MRFDPDSSVDIVVTGLGAVSALGHGCPALWDAIEAGRDGIGPVTRFSTAELQAHLGAEVPLNEPPGPEADLALGFAGAAADEAWAMARAHLAHLDPRRVALVVGTSVGRRRQGLAGLSLSLAAHLGVAGPCLTVGTACCASTGALGLARDVLRAGWADLVIAGGADALTPEVYAGFHALGSMSPTPCAPFSEPVGLTLGEGAGFAVLETATAAHARGAPALARVAGYGLSADAFHPTTPEPNGAGIARAIASALADAGLAPGDVGYVNVHGTGTAASDPAEWRALVQVFGSEVPAFSSTKSFLGHAQGAAGILEAIATITGLRCQRVPPTLHFTRPRHGCPAAPIARSSPLPLEHRHAVSTSSAFGGANAAVVLGVAGDGTPGVSARPGPAAPVLVLGAGAVGPHGVTLDALAAVATDGSPAPGRVPPFRLEPLVRGLDPRNLDPATRYLIASASQALRDAGLRISGALRERTGHLVGTTQVSPATVIEYLTSLRDRGLPGVSAAAFARMVPNAPTGACASALSLRGPSSTLALDADAGLAAVVHAAEWLSRRTDAEVLVASGVDELPPDAATVPPTPAPAELFIDPGTAEGAASLVLGTARVPRGAGAPPPVILAGWGLAGPGLLRLAVDQAMHRAGTSVADLGSIHGSAPPEDVAAALGLRRLPCPLVDQAARSGRAPAVSSLLGAVAAVLSLRRGAARTALIIATGGRCASLALVLKPGESP